MAGKKGNLKSVEELESTSVRSVGGFQLEVVPMPDSNVGAPNKYPFRDMKVGESFVTIGDKAVNNVRAATHKFAKVNPTFAFATRQAVDETGVPMVKDGHKVYRTWRVEPAPTNG